MRRVYVNGDEFLFLELARLLLFMAMWANRLACLPLLKSQMNHIVKDTLQIKILMSDAERGYVEEVHFFINGEKFVELVQKQEWYFAVKEGRPKGSHPYVWPRNCVKTRLVFMGAAETYNRGKADLLQCDCGTPGCWDLLFKINVESEQVTWSSFEQPHRGPKSRVGHWDYSEFGPFVFERSQYEAEVAKIAAAL